MLDIHSSQFIFPDPEQVDPEGEGLVGIGADLSPATLLEAYRQGIFPWFSKDDPICWWSPDPRCIIYPKAFQPSKSLLRQLKKDRYTLTLSHAFEQVVQACAQPRAYTQETWINQSIIKGYTGLHQAGLAHSVEVWEGEQLVGGLYGVQIGRAFFGESMFSRQTDVSKMAFYFLMQLCRASNIEWVDCQLPNDHLFSLGATTLPRQVFLQALPDKINLPPPNWQAVTQQIFNSQYLLTTDAFLHLIP
ncbi:leucyl/phenylalanyl-tRNA--protein transferase [Alkanindiges sp. WGS2144]|uniref:leucyl/phenylalanyl-tRNA--protein transferase n=1 Tax=Alkanindiges sp. WGS2144 TaxID=3366808 RepID=UPI00375248A1